MSAPATHVSRPELTPRQREIYDFIAARITECGYPPTIREIGAHLGIRSTNGVADHLKALKRKGFLRQTASKSRTWQPLRRTPQPKAEPASSVTVPILGRVAAGQPILAHEGDEGSLQLDPAFLPRRGHTFALRVAGDSMVEAGILNDDVIFVDKQREAPPGSIAVVLIDEEATVKRIYHDGERVLLQPANAAMRTLVVHADDGRRVEVLGVVVGLYRRF